MSDEVKPVATLRRRVHTTWALHQKDQWSLAMEIVLTLAPVPVEGAGHYHGRSICIGAHCSPGDGLVDMRLGAVEGEAEAVPDPEAER